MDAILGNIFLVIQAQIAAEVPAIKFIDLDTGQLEYKDSQERPAVLLPCVLFDFVQADYEDASQGVQTGDMLLEVRLGVDPFTQATHYFTETQKANALNFFNLEHQLNQALHNWCNSQYFAPLSRKSMRREARKDGLRVRVSHYKFQLIDNTAQVVTTTIARPDMVVNEQ